MQELLVFSILGAIIGFVALHMARENISDADYTYWFSLCITLGVFGMVTSVLLPIMGNPAGPLAGGCLAVLARQFTRVKLGDPTIMVTSLDPLYVPAEWVSTNNGSPGEEPPNPPLSGAPR